MYVQYVGYSLLCCTVLSTSSHTLILVMELYLVQDLNEISCVRSPRLIKIIEIAMTDSPAYWYLIMIVPEREEEVDLTRTYRFLPRRCKFLLS